MMEKLIFQFEPTFMLFRGSPTLPWFFTTGSFISSRVSERDRVRVTEKE